MFKSGTLSDTFLCFSVQWSDIQFNQGQLDELAFMFFLLFDGLRIRMNTTQ